MGYVWLHLIEGSEENTFRGEAVWLAEQVNCTGKSLLFMRQKRFYCSFLGFVLSLLIQFILIQK